MGILFPPLKNPTVKPECLRLFGVFYNNLGFIINVNGNGEDKKRVQLAQITKV
jgi:hypothetical protein